MRSVMTREPKRKVLTRDELIRQSVSRTFTPAWTPELSYDRRRQAIDEACVATHSWLIERELRYPGVVVTNRQLQKAANRIAEKIRREERKQDMHDPLFSDDEADDGGPICAADLIPSNQLWKTVQSEGMKVVDITGVPLFEYTQVDFERMAQRPIPPQAKPYALTPEEFDFVNNYSGKHSAADRKRYERLKRKLNDFLIKFGAFAALDLRRKS